MQRAKQVKKAVMVVLVMVGLIFISPIIGTENSALAGQVMSSGQKSTIQGGRQTAIDATQNFNPGTVGHDVHIAVSSVYPFVGEMWNGGIGNHYQDVETQKLLALPDTNENLLNFAQRETKWWQANPDPMAKVIGGKFPATARASILMCVRKSEDPEHECKIESPFE